MYEVCKGAAPTANGTGTCLSLTSELSEWAPLLTQQETRCCCRHPDPVLEVASKQFPAASRLNACLLMFRAKYKVHTYSGGRGTSTSQRRRHRSSRRPPTALPCGGAWPSVSCFCCLPLARSFSLAPAAPSNYLLCVHTTSTHPRPTGEPPCRTRSATFCDQWRR